ncbi:MAG: iron chelate uptake ABC transporter family permease subunit, partial [Microbacterium sp.]
MTSSVIEIRRRVGRRRVVVVAGVLLVVLAVAVLSFLLGDYPLAPADLWRTVWGGGDRAQSYVVFQVRAPRLAMALLTGMALGAAGALLHALLRNSLASPDLLGISAGSGMTAVFAILVLGISGPLLAVAAFGGGILVAAFLLLAGRHRADGGYRLILAGVGVAFLCIAVTNYLMVKAQVELAQSALIWLTGSLASTPWWNVATVAVVIALTLPAVVAGARWLP